MNYAAASSDSDRQAILRVLKSGADLARPMKIDFHVAAPTDQSAQRIALAAREQGFEVIVSRNQSGAAWTCSCSRSMVLSHDELMRVQEQLNELSHPFGGYSDGWGTFGNQKNG